MGSSGRTYGSVGGVYHGVARWVLLLAVGMASCVHEVPQEERNRVLARVDDVPITVGDFETSYVGFLIATGQNDTPANRHLHLATLMDASLLADEADRRGYGADSTFQSIVERARRQAIGGRFFETALLETLPPIDEAEVRRAFVRSKQQVVVRHLFYRDRAEATAAYERLLAGHDFLEEAAACYHLPAIDSSAGMLGPIRYFQVDDAFAEAAFALDPGEISEPVRSRYGYHVIRVEEIFGTPIITESEYRHRREGMANQVALRTRRLEGDRFVRTFMEGLGVRVDAPAVRSLAEAIGRLENRGAGEAGRPEDRRTEPAERLEERGAASPVEVYASMEVAWLDLQALRRELTPDTPLATYVIEGDTTVFTAGDYYFWLPTLPFSEARHRTAASVGRALRNDAFFRAGLHHSLSRDPHVSAAMEQAARRERTRRIRDTLRTNPPAAIPEAHLRAAFDRSPAARRIRWTASFWTIPFATRSEAEAARARLTADPSQAPTYARYRNHTEANPDALPAWAAMVRQAPLRQVLLSQRTSGEWALIRVERRRSEPAVPYAAVKDSLRQAIAPRYREYRLLRHLHARAHVTMDSLLFAQIGRLGGE